MLERSVREMRATNSKPLTTIGGTNTHCKLALNVHSQRFGLPLDSLLDMASHPSSLLGRDRLEKRRRIFVLLQLIDQVLDIVRWAI